MRPLFLFLILLLASCGESAAPPVREQSFIVRVAYVTDVKVKPYASIDRCDVTRKFMAKELPEMDGYTLVVRCVPVGNVN